jgi:hypothetical protein
MKCTGCGKQTSNNKYCSNHCQMRNRVETKVKMWLDGETDGNGLKGTSEFIRNYLLRKYNNSCQRCGWNKINEHTLRVPLELHHIDSNPYNSNENNLMILCPNCHALTNNFKNGGAHKSFRKR